MLIHALKWKSPAKLGGTAILANWVPGLCCVGGNYFLPSQRKRSRTVSRVIWGEWCGQGRREGANFHLLGSRRKKRNAFLIGREGDLQHLHAHQNAWELICDCLRSPDLYFNNKTSMGIITPGWPWPAGPAAHRMGETSPHFCTYHGAKVTQTLYGGRGVTVLLPCPSLPRFGSQSTIEHHLSSHLLSELRAAMEAPHGCCAQIFLLSKPDFVHRKVPWGVVKGRLLKTTPFLSFRENYFVLSLTTLLLNDAGGFEASLIC